MTTFVATKSAEGHDMRAGRWPRCSLALQHTLVPKDESAFCVLTANSPDLVERAWAAAGT